MPAVPPRPIIGHPNANLPHLGKAEGSGTAGNEDTGARPAQFVSAWHDLNLSVARSLPTALLRAGQLQRATLLSIGQRGRVRR